jgi:phosphate transport system protein
MPRSEFHAQLAALRSHTLELGGLTVTALERVIGALQEDDRPVAREIAATDDIIDELHAAIQRESIVILAMQQPTARDLRAITAAMMIAGELERIGDYVTGIAKLICRELREPALPPAHDLYRMARASRRMLQRSLDAYATQDAALARRVWHDDPTIDTFQQRLYNDLLMSMTHQPHILVRATHLLFTVHNLERIADRATNICEQILFMVEGEWPRFVVTEEPSGALEDSVLPGEERDDDARPSA